MTTTTTIVTHEATGISAPIPTWVALGAEWHYTDSTRAGCALSRLPHGTEALLYFGIQATGSRGEAAVIAAIVERDRRREEQTRATATARLADAVSSIARELGAETAQGLIERLPAKIRPYVEEVYRRR